MAIGFPLKTITEPFMGAKVEINSLCLSMAENRKREEKETRVKTAGRQR